jgi:integrase
VFRYRDRASGKLRDKGLGPYPDISLSDARKLAGEQRRLLLDGHDPIDKRREAVTAARLARGRAKTFGYCCASYIAAHEAGWRNPKHASQWRNTLDTYAADLMPLPVQAIDTALVVNALEPIWTSKTETATRVRGRIEMVLDWATARELRKGENPARWKGHLDKLLPAVAKVKTVTPRPALPYTEVGKFMAELEQVDSLASLALRLQILTATRPGEAVAARWPEFDLEAKVWTVPAERMKAGKKHRVPLPPELVRMLKAIPSNGKGLLFPGNITSRSKGDGPQPITTAATLKLLKSLRPGYSDHGFRSTFRDWAADQTVYANEVVEAALAHTIKDKSEAAYKRTDMLERRARLMKDWARFCKTPNKTSGKVTPIRRRA